MVKKKRLSNLVLYRLLNLILSSSLLFSIKSWSQEVNYNKFRSFNISLTEMLGWKTDRLNDVTKSIRLVKMSDFSGSAESLYRPFLNTIEVKESFLKHNGLQRRMKSVDEFYQFRGFNWFIDVSTTFHEIAHAEMDFFVEEKKTYQDRRLWRVLENEIKPWFIENFPSFNSRAAVEELFGYYRGEILMMIAEDTFDILSRQGINIFSQQCYILPRMKSQISNLTEEEFVTFYSTDSDPQYYRQAYWKIAAPKNIFINGEVIDLNSGAIPFKEKWSKELWKHFYYFYSPVQNRNELAKQIFSKNRWVGMEFIPSCRRKLFRSYLKSL